MVEKTGNYLIEAKGISKIFGGTRVLDNVSITLKPVSYTHLYRGPDSRRGANF